MRTDGRRMGGRKGGMSGRWIEEMDGGTDG